MKRNHNYLVGRVSHIALGAVFLLAMILTVVPASLSHNTRTNTQLLAELVSASAEGWTVKELDIADSAEMKGAVEWVLRLGEVVFRRYLRADPKGPGTNL